MATAGTITVRVKVPYLTKTKLMLARLAARLHLYWIARRLLYRLAVDVRAGSRPWQRIYRGI